MPQITLFDSGAGITGSGGFIGSRLTEVLGRESAFRSYPADVGSLEELQALARQGQVQSLIHLAASGTVLTEFSKVPRMLDVSVRGGLNAVEAFRPRRVIYSSTCAVYGNAAPSGGLPVWDHVHPVSIYGLSKAIAEKTLTQWASRTGSTAVNLRLGNVVGPGCAGLITYLVRHALQYPDGSVPARMRGGGKIVRDYVPVDYVVEILRRSIGLNLESGESRVYNVGSGRPLANGDIAAIVKEWLSVQGYLLRIEFQAEAGEGEALFSGLRTESTEQAFDLKPPSEDEVRNAVIAGASSFLARQKSAVAVSAS